MFKEEYKNAYEEIKADDGSVNKILELSKRKNADRTKGLGWKPVIVSMLLTLTLFVGVNIPTFAQEINRMIHILETGAIDYTDYKSLQRDHPEWIKNGFVPRNASVSRDGIIMTVELATFCERDFIAILSFANEEGYNWIHNGGNYSWYDASAKIGDYVAGISSGMEFLKYDEEKNKVYYVYTAQRHTARVPEGEMVDIQIKGFFEDALWEEALDLSNVALEADTRVVTLYNSNVNETLVQLENTEFPYMASVLNMTPLSEIKNDTVTLTGAAYIDGVLRVQTCQPDNGVYNMEYRLAYIESSKKELERLIWYEKIDGKLMMFTEQYFDVSDINKIPVVMKFHEKNGCWNTSWMVSFEVEKQ